MVERLRRWWVRSGLLVSAAVLALVAGWWIRQTEGEVIAEVFSILASPFVYPPPTPAQKLDDRFLQTQARAEAMDLENRQLRKLLKLEDSLGDRAVTARVIGRSADHWWQELLVNRGRADGVEIGSTVVSDGGAVVGQVDHLSENTSRVLLLSDPTSQVGVMAARSRLMGVLQGRRRDKAWAEFFEQQPLKVGELIVTSGLSSRFPAGLPVGRVGGIDRNQAVPRTIVNFIAPMGRLEWVKIYPANPAVKIKPLPPPPPPPPPPAPVQTAPTPAVTTSTPGGSLSSPAPTALPRAGASTPAGSTVTKPAPTQSTPTPAPLPSPQAKPVPSPTPAPAGQPRPRMAPSQPGGVASPTRTPTLPTPGQEPGREPLRPLPAPTPLPAPRDTLEIPPTPAPAEQPTPAPENRPGLQDANSSTPPTS